MTLANALIEASPAPTRSPSDLDASSKALAQCKREILSPHQQTTSTGASSETPFRSAALLTSPLVEYGMSPLGVFTRPELVAPHARAGLHVFLCVPPQLNTTQPEMRMMPE